jgi:RNA polymerase sigma factor (sigma-70 family)
MARMDAPGSDEAFLARFALGDAAAFGTLYERYELPLWRYVLRHARDRSAAEEIAQEVWFAVVREAVRFRPDGRFRPWLFTIARNRVIDRARTAHPHASLDAVTPGTTVPLAEVLADERSLPPDRDAERLEQGRALLAALEALPAEQREAFVLQVDAGLSVEEIATVTGTGYETVKSRLRYARERLKTSLRDYA